MKYTKILFLALLGVLTITSCNKDDDIIITPTVIDFGTAPSATLISTGTVNVLTENTVRYHVVNFTNLPFTATVVETENDIVIVDLSSSAAFGAELRTYTDAINKPGSVIITHNHGDHYGGAGSYTDYDFYAESVVAGQLNATDGFTALYPNAVIGVENSQTIGGLSYTFDKISNAETGENGYLYNTDHKIVFVGDLVFNLTHSYIREYTPNEGEDEIDNWIAGLNTLNNQFSEYNHLFVGHNGSRSDVTAVIDENITYLQAAQSIINGTQTITGGGIATNQQDVIDELQLLYPNHLFGGLLFSLPDAFFPGDPGADWF